MVVSILLTYTKPFTVEQRTEVLLLCHCAQHLNGPNAFEFPAKTKAVCVGFVLSESWEKRHRKQTCLSMYNIYVYSMITFLDDIDSENCACGRYKNEEKTEHIHLSSLIAIFTRKKAPITTNTKVHALINSSID